MPRRDEPDPTAQIFGQAIKRILTERGETLETVAGRIERTGRDGELTHMDPKYLLSLEGGWHSPTITTAHQIAQSLEVTLSELVRNLGGAPRKPTTPGVAGGD